MLIRPIQTGSTLVSSGTPDRNSHRFKYAYTGLFQSRKKRIQVPVKCFYIKVGNHHLLVDAGWSQKVRTEPLKHLGFGLWFASEPVMGYGEAACEQLAGQPIDAILMTHLDCDHVSGLCDFNGIPIYTSTEEIAYSQKKRLRYGKLVEGFDFHTMEFKADGEAPFAVSCDLFGDSTVIAHLTPTHSAGSIIYKIQEEGRFVLFVGDNGYMHASWELGILPGPLYDENNMRKCLYWINEQSKLPNCDGVYCAHDPL